MALSAGAGDPHPLVSVITAVRNGAATLQRTIDSIAVQRWPRIEHLIVDGGSTDGTIDIIRRNSSHIAWWRSARDGGISSAFNIGIARARGDIVGILSADDAYAPGGLDDSVQALLGATEAGFSFGGCLFRGAKRGSFAIMPDHGYAATIATRMPALNHATVFVRAEVYRRHGGFSRRWRLAMDYDLILRWHRAGIVGVPVDRIVAHAGLDGASQRRYFATLAEVMRISMRHGAPASAAAASFAAGAAKRIAGLLLEGAGADAVARWARRQVNPHVGRGAGQAG